MSLHVRVTTQSGDDGKVSATAVATLDGVMGPYFTSQPEDEGNLAMAAALRLVADWLETEEEQLI